MSSNVFSDIAVLCLFFVRPVRRSEVWSCGKNDCFRILQNLNIYVFAELLCLKTAPTFQSADLRRQTARWLYWMRGFWTSLNALALGNFFSIVCSKIFSKLVVFFLRRLHLNSTTEDPEFPKIQFPPSDACPLCYSPQHGWNEEAVAEYLIGRYSASNVCNEYLDLNSVPVTGDKVGINRMLCSFGVLLFSTLVSFFIFSQGSF